MHIRYFSEVVVSIGIDGDGPPHTGVATPGVRIRTYIAVLPDYIRTLLFGPNRIDCHTEMNLKFYFAQ